MKVNLSKVFAMNAPAENAWAFLQDIKGVAGCMPGAEITAQVDETHYQGKVKAKIGPATLAFDGNIEILETDPENRTLRMLGKGQDNKGTSAAEMDLTASVRTGEGGVTELVGASTVTVTGKAANFGGRMMTQVADRILDQFGKNFINNVIAMGEGAAAEEAAAKVSEQPRELNGLAFLWSVIVGYCKSLFGKKTPRSQ